MLTPEQTEQLKKQLIEQVESTFPDDKKELAKKQIELMNSEQLEIFLKQNNLIKTEQNSNNQQCVFCSIVSGQVQSYKIEEDDGVVAILEINPISRGHTILIPKEHASSTEKISQKNSLIAKKISKRIKTKLKPKNIAISSSNLFGHEIINILPVYENETMNSKRHKEKPEELEGLQKILEKKQKTIKKPRTKKIKSEKLWLPKRIP